MLGVVDSLMVGKVGTASLAASSLVNGLYFLVLVLGIGITSAITPMVAIARGGKRDEECGVIINQAFIVNGIFSIILAVLLFILANFIKYFDQPPEVAVLAESYLKTLAISSIPFMIFQVYKQFYEGVSDVIVPMVIALLANISNAFFNWVFIFGKFGFEPMGLDGAGYSTLLNRTFMAVAIMIMVFRSEKFKRYHLHFRLNEISISIVKKLLQIGLPSGFQYFLEVGSFSFAAIMIGWIGEDGLAAHQIAINLASVSYMLILGISAAGTIRVADAYGQHDKKNIRLAGFTVLLLAVGVMACFGIFFVIFRNFLPTLYVSDNEVINIASNLIIIAAMFQIFDGMQASGVAILKGLTDVKIPMLFSFFSYWIISIPIGALFGFYFQMGVVGIWIGLSLGLALVGIFTATRFNRLSRIVD